MSEGWRVERCIIRDTTISEKSYSMIKLAHQPSFHSFSLLPVARMSGNLCAFRTLFGCTES